MWIESIEPHTDEWNRSPISLRPGINIIRGGNGIGKTTILEYASLLGHVVLMGEPDDPESKNAVTITVNFDNNDIQYLDIVDKNADLKKFIDEYAKNTNLDIDTSKLTSPPLDQDAIDLKFIFRGEDLGDIKNILASDEKIRDRISVFSKNPLAIAWVKLINLWSRPIEMLPIQQVPATGESPGPPPREWAITPRTRSLVEKNSVILPGATFYLNTDMYDFGAGLDVRESPKDLQLHLVDVMIKRLQLVHPSSIHQNETNLQNCFIETTVDVQGSDQMRDIWNTVFRGVDDEPDKEIKHAFKSWQISFHEGKISSEIMIAGDIRREFVSSGENQALFILSMLGNYGSLGSCIIIDEPELHLSFSVGSKLVDTIIRNMGGADRPCQVIMVTHLPHLYRDRIIIEDRAPFRRLSPPRNVHFIYVDTNGSNKIVSYGLDGANSAARSSHDDVRTLADGLRIHGDVDIPLLSWMYRKCGDVRSRMAQPHGWWHLGFSVLWAALLGAVCLLSGADWIVLWFAAIPIAVQWIWFAWIRLKRKAATALAPALEFESAPVISGASDETVSSEVPIAAGTSAKITPQ